MTILRLSVALLGSSCLWAGYQANVTDNLTSIDSSKWTQIGSLSSGSNGVTGNGSLISTVPSPTGGDYDIRMTVHTVSQGACSGSYSLYARSTPDNSTSYVLTINIATIGLFKKVANSWTALAWMPYYCADGTVMRLVARGGDLTMWSGPNMATYHDLSPIAAGQAGVGISSSDTIGNVKLGPIDYIAPPAISPAAVSVSVAPNRVDLRWPQGTDDSNGIGLQGYLVYQNGVYLGSPTAPSWLDQTVLPGEAISYTLYAYDQHGNVSAPAVVNVSVPPGLNISRPEAESRLGAMTPKLYSGSQVDQRRVGVRPTGAYWGAAGEQIDLLSGNLNFSVPLFQAMGRGWQPSTRSSALPAPCC